MNPATKVQEAITLGDLTQGILRLPQTVGHRIVNGICLDSRQAKSNDLFLALAGHERHGLQFLQKVAAAGVQVVFYDPAQGGSALAENWSKEGRGLSLIPVPRLGQVVGELANRFYNSPSQHLKVIGITGTNGKTSCSHFLAQALGKKYCGVVGTLGNGFIGELNSSLNTTPDAVQLQAVLSEMHQQGATSMAMEVSSHAMVQKRTQGTHFYGAVFTNLTRDHLDYHGSMEAYFRAKLRLFVENELQFAVVNLDDLYSYRLLREMARPPKLLGFTRAGNVEPDVNCLVVSHVEHLDTGVSMRFAYQGQSAQVDVPVIGDFNVDNLAAVTCVLLALGYPFTAAINRIEQISAIPGRMQVIPATDSSPAVVIDYAHTPDALKTVLKSLRHHCKGELWVVFGCGGNRDEGKRPQMGSVAQQYADRVIITDDNPRREDPLRITQQILVGFETSGKQPEIIGDRRQAITRAITHAGLNDLVLLAGKGHESTQEINDLKLLFNDYQVAAELLQFRRGNAT